MAHLDGAFSHSIELHGYEASSLQRIQNYDQFIKYVSEICVLCEILDVFCVNTTSIWSYRKLRMITKEFNEDGPIASYSSKECISTYKIHLGILAVFMHSTNN